MLVADTVGRQSAAGLPVPEDDGVVLPDESLLRGRLKNSETLRDLEALFGHLSTKRHAELSALIQTIRAYLMMFQLAHIW